MTFLDQVATDLEGVVDSGEFSSEITYTPPGGQGSTINAIVGPIETIHDNDDIGEMKIKRRSVTILTDSQKGVAQPVAKAIVTIGSENWEVVSIGPEGFGKATLSCTWIEPQSRHHEMHKRKID